MKLAMNKNMIIRDEAFGCLIHHISAGLIYILNETGREILCSCNGRLTSDDIVKKMKKTYQLGRNAEAQIKDFIDGLVRNGIVTLDKKIVPNSISQSMTSFSPLSSFESNPLSYVTLSAPIVAYWEITSTCNLRCVHCYKNASVATDRRELNTKEIKDVIDQLAERKVFWLAITGGEPLMKKDIFNILRYASSKIMCLMLSTNGTFVNEKTVKRLKEIGLRSVQVSIDGIGKIHDEFRGQKGTFEKAVNAVKLFIKAGIPDVTISSVATKYNLREIPKIVELAVSLGASRYRVITLMPTGRAMTNIKKLWLSNDEKLELRNMLLDVSQKNADRIHISQEERSFNLLNSKVHKSEVPLGCAASRSICKINPAGDVYPCSFFDDKKTIAGSLKEKTFKAIWDDARIFKLLRSLDHLEGKCANCKELKFCGGGCRAVAYNFHKSIYAEDPSCWLMVK